MRWLVALRGQITRKIYTLDLLFRGEVVKRISILFRQISGLVPHNLVHVVVRPYKHCHIA